MEKTPPQKAALYVRVSTEEQASEGQSASAQAEVLKQYCKAFGMEVYKVYEDLGYSGKSIKGRPGLSALLEDSRSKCFDTVLVWKISRLSRSLKDLLLIIDILEKNGIAFSSYSEKFDTSTPVGRMTLQLLGSIAEFERNTIIENVKLGLREFGRKGGKTGSVLGYDNKDKKLEINENEAAAVRLIFDLYTGTNMSFSAIAFHINRLGCKTKRNCSFTASGVSEIIGNPVYIGLNRHNIGKANEFIVRGSHKPLISLETWNKAQQRRISEKRQRSGGYSGTALLSGLVKCADCGLPMKIFYAYSGNKAYRYYRCCRKSSGTGCSNYINADKLDSRIICFVKSVLSSAAVSEDIKRLLQSKPQTDTYAFWAEEDELKRLKKSRDRYLNLFEKYKISEEKAFIERIKELERRIIMLEKKETEPMERLESCSRAFRSLLCSPGPTELKTLLPFIVRNIKVSEKHAYIETSFPVKEV